MLISCPSCHQKISDYANSCPHCGDNFARFRKEKLGQKLCGLMALLFTFGAVISTVAAYESAHLPPGYMNYTADQIAREVNSALSACYITWGFALLFWIATFFGNVRIGSKG